MGELWRRVRMLLGRRRWRRELAQEMRLHRELRGSGSVRRFGNELRLLERSQAQWGWTWLETWAQDIRHGLRLLRRTPLITALALVSLGLGIGATTALFTLTDAILLRPLPVSHPEQLAQVYTQAPRMKRPSPSFTNPMWEQVRDHEDVFSGAFAWSANQFVLTTGGPRETVWGVWASGGYFSTLGVHAEMGRVFGPQDDYPSCPNIADISDAFWRSRFGGSAKALGATLRLDGHLYTVVGVMQAGFPGTDVGTQVNVVVPLCDERQMLNVRDAWWLMVMGRLRPGMSLKAAGVRLAATAPAWLAATVPGDWTAAEQAGYRARRMGLASGARGMSRIGRRYGSALEILLAIAGLILLVACANLAALMLARAAARRQEIAVRQALGAGRARLIRQLMTESALLAAGGLALGVAFAKWACRAAETLLKAQLNLAPDGRMLACAIGATVLTGLLVGLAPALSTSRAQAPSRAAGRRAAVAAVAIAVVLLAGAGLFLRSFAKLGNIGLGFDPAHVTLLEVDNQNALRISNAAVAARAQALAALRALPGVSSASGSFIIPGQGMEWDTPVHSRTGAIPDALLNGVSPGYFATLRTPLLAGRDFKAQDRRGTATVAIVNEAAARMLFPNGRVLGQEIMQGEGKDIQRAQVVGVVADAKYLTVQETAPAQVYFALAQLKEGFPTTSFELRSSLPGAVLGAEVKLAMAAADPAASYAVLSYNRLLVGILLPQRLLAWLSALFGGLALLLTAIGLYGIMAYNAERRRREFGIRLALGAEPRSVLRLALGDAAWVVGIGVSLGVPLAWASARAAQAELSKLLYGLRPTDAATLGAAVAVLVAAALVAAWLPARRAARTDPMSTLRDE
ncbi:MAG: FtsX-like permease family protein [Acidobacteria bacterium]|nr:MAG: FtsX-like permease family protein [Acidobacteriota bacterium]